MSEHTAPPPPHTGQGDVDGVLDDLVEVFDRPVDDQVAAIDDAHARLREALDGETDRAPRPGAPATADRPRPGG